MAGPASRGPPHFTIFKTAAQEAAEMKISPALENEPAAPPASSDAESPKLRSAQELEHAIEELVFALYAEDVRLGIVRDRDILDVGGALSAAGGTRYHRRAAEILRSLTRVPDRQIMDACAAEPADTPRGAAARAELRLRGLTMP
jgi:hypothetical protein